MERARKKTMTQDAEDTLVMEPAGTEPSRPVAKRGKAVAAKKSAEPKVVEPLEPSPVGKVDPEATSTEPKVASETKPATARRGRPAKAASAPKTSAPAPRTPRSAKAKTAPAKTAKAGVAKAAVAKVKAPSKSPAPKPVKTKPATKAALAKPGPSKGVVPLEAGAEIKLGFLAGSVGFHLRLAQDASYRAFARHRDKDLIKPGRLPALAIIHLNPGISQSALGRAIARDKSTVSPLIKDLQKNGFISRKASTADRRSVTLALTKKGERTLERLQARAQEHENEVDKIIGTSKSRLLSMLEKITTGMAP